MPAFRRARPLPAPQQHQVHTHRELDTPLDSAKPDVEFSDRFGLLIAIFRSHAQLSLEP